ncbi:MAG: hypothetical protein WA364_16000 [Candidatus Nitrosopolaris sp.]
MTKGKGILFLFVLVLFMWGAMTLANPGHGYVHVGKTVGTAHGVYHKGYNHTHTRNGSPIGTWDIPRLRAGVTSHIIIKITS